MYAHIASNELRVNSLVKIQQRIREKSLKNKKIPDFLGKLIPVITERVKAYHGLFSLPLIAEQWEETLHRSFLDIGQSTTWKPDRSHKVGEDMRLAKIDNSRISCKSGQFIRDSALGKTCVKFNGSRSTSFKNLEEKLEHFSADHDDYYFMLAKDKTFNKLYKLLVFKSNICKVNQLEWSQSTSGKTWNGIGDFKATIGKSMSAQLWTTFPLDMISYQFDINCKDEKIEDSTDLSFKTVKYLKLIAKENKVKNYSKMKKCDLLSILSSLKL